MPSKEKDYPCSQIEIAKEKFDNKRLERSIVDKNISSNPYRKKEEESFFLFKKKEREKK